MALDTILLRIPRFWSRRSGRGPERTHPVVLAAAVLLLSAAVWSVVGWSTWYIHDLGAGLPDRLAMGRLGDMAQATTVFDGADRPVFTIFKEQRIEVPLPRSRRTPFVPSWRSRTSASTITAVWISSGSSRRLSPTSRKGRAAQGGSTITQQLARQRFLTRDKTVRTEAQGSNSRDKNRAPLHEG